EAGRQMGQGTRRARVRIVHPGPTFPYDIGVRGRTRRLHVRHSAARQVGHPAALWPRLDSRGAHAGRVHRRQRIARGRRRVRTHCQKPSVGMSDSRKSGSRKRTVAVLGATGAVGQQFIRLLINHPWFELTEVAASERSAGKAYAEAAKWIGSDAMPASVASMIVKPCDPASVSADIVFSALDAAAAQDAEPAFARAGKMVLTNAKSYRMDPDVPLVIA